MIVHSDGQRWNSFCFVFLFHSFILGRMIVHSDGQRWNSKPFVSVFLFLFVFVSFIHSEEILRSKAAKTVSIHKRPLWKIKESCSRIEPRSLGLPAKRFNTARSNRLARVKLASVPKMHTHRRRCFLPKKSALSGEVRLKLTRSSVCSFWEDWSKRECVRSGNWSRTIYVRDVLQASGIKALFAKGTVTA